MSAGQEEQRAGFAPPETGGLVAGLRPLQLIVGGIGAGLAVLVASLVPTVAAPVALLPGLAVLVFALARIGGELALDRALTAAGFLVRRLRGRFASGAHERGIVIREPSTAAGGTGRVGAPRSWGRLRIVSHEVERGSVGVLLDDATGTAAGVLVARADTAPLLDTAEAMRRAEEFAALIVALARDARPVRRVSFVARRLPAEAGEHAAWFAQRRAAPLSATVVGTYADLVEQVRGDAVQHDLAVTLQISLRARRAELRALQRSGASREDAAARLVCEELRWLAAALDACGCRVAGALQPSLLCEALRSGVDPATPERMSRIRTAKSDDGMTSIAAGPGILEEGWSQLRSEAGWARTLWAASLPATAEAGFLAPLLAAAGGARSVALTLEPLAPRRATRLAQATVLDAEADAARREQRGTLDTALARTSPPGGASVGGRARRRTRALPPRRLRDGARRLTRGARRSNGASRARWRRARASSCASWQASRHARSASRCPACAEGLCEALPPPPHGLDGAARTRASLPLWRGTGATRARRRHRSGGRAGLLRPLRALRQRRARRPGRRGHGRDRHEANRASSSRSFCARSARSADAP